MIFNLACKGRKNREEAEKKELTPITFSTTYYITAMSFRSAYLQTGRRNNAKGHIPNQWVRTPQPIVVGNPISDRCPIPPPVTNQPKSNLLK